MDDEIKKLVQPIFTDIEMTPAVSNFYQELMIDLQTVAEIKTTFDANLDVATAIKNSLDEAGDLKSVVKVIASKDSSDSNSMKKMASINVKRQLKGQYLGESFQRISVNAPSGDIRIGLSRTDDISIAYRQGGIFAGTLVVEDDQIDGDLKINLPKLKKETSFLPFMTVKQIVDIRVPQSFVGKLSITADTGHVEFENVVLPKLEVGLKLNAGNLHLHRTELKLIQLQMSKGSLFVEKTMVQEWRFALQAGSANFVDTAGNFDATLHAGDIKGVGLQGAGQFFVKNGNIQVDWQNITGNVSFNVESGKLVSQQPIDRGFGFDLQAQNGIVRMQRSAQYDVHTISHARGATDNENRYQLSGNVQTGIIVIR